MMNPAIHRMEGVLDERMVMRNAKVERIKDAMTAALFLLSVNSLPENTTMHVLNT